MNKIINTTQMQPTSNPLNIKETNPIVNKPMKSLENKTQSTKKGLIEYDMRYDIVEDIKKNKENISLFELCNLPQQRKKLLEAFNTQPSSTPEAI